MVFNSNIFDASERQIINHVPYINYLHSSFNILGLALAGMTLEAVISTAENKLQANDSRFFFCLFHQMEFVSEYFVSIYERKSF